MISAAKAAARQFASARSSLQIRIHCMKTRFFYLLLLVLALTLAPCLTNAHAQTSDEDVQKKEADLKQQKIELQKKELNLQQRELELEQAKKDLQYQENGRSLSMNLSGDVLFDYNKATLKPQAQDALKKVAVVLSQFPESDVTIEGYTDSKGSKSFNKTLSRDRADAVKGWLVKQGDIPAGKISAVGNGEENPVAPNKNPDGSDNPAGRAKNRRVSVIIAKPATTPTP